MGFSNPFISRNGCVHFESVDGVEAGGSLYLSVLCTLCIGPTGLGRTGEDWGGLGRMRFVYCGNGLIWNGMERDGME